LSKLPVLASTQLVKILRSLGFERVRQKGSHAYFRHTDGRTTVVPLHRGEDLGRGLLRSILRDIELTPDQFDQVRRDV
jgi:predicted RNA binding protein YcfA (HicA-like mRNA interferase family)